MGCILAVSLVVMEDKILSWAVLFDELDGMGTGVYFA